MQNRHPSFDASYDTATPHDTNNGALHWTSTSEDFPGVVCHEIHYYATGRGADRLWYEADKDPARKEFSTPDAALKHTRSLAAMPDATLIAELKRRGHKL